MEDLAQVLRGYRESVEFNPRRLEALEDRLALITRLKRKYGAGISEILAFAADARQELGAISHREERVADGRADEVRLIREIGQMADALSRARHEAAETLSRLVERELADLNMARTRFVVSFTRAEDPAGVPVESEMDRIASDGSRREPGRYAFDATGIDRIEYLLSPNPGEPPRPLARIASGGEMARVMLALKTVLSDADPVPTLIFDEIDVGVGGRSGQVVGQKLWALAARHQVVCVTHLPQTAVYGDDHVNVAKEVEGERTAVRIASLQRNERVEEIALMLGSASDTARLNALEMLEHAEQWKSARDR